MSVYVVRYGTMSALVEAASPEEAELRLRTGITDPRWTLAELEFAAGIRDEHPWSRRIKLDRRSTRPPIRGEVFVRKACAADVKDWIECGGKLSGVPKALRPG